MPFDAETCLETDEESGGGNGFGEGRRRLSVSLAREIFPSEPRERPRKWDLPFDHGVSGRQMSGRRGENRFGRGGVFIFRKKDVVEKEDFKANNFLYWKDRHCSLRVLIWKINWIGFTFKRLSFYFRMEKITTFSVLAESIATFSLNLDVLGFFIYKPE
ncbi:hypothetical protein CEXT_480991 [Caerostris extrusa]|uniref:Uncharacterized protein n=1 Tax=Caerostris extrusa TaxID=172846 RepID=A0AAV4R831_CAEEX|nr:hypothetical protein CEXT_480991 [Caerostris extrusa]